jgi:hypothetical protein
MERERIARWLRSLDDGGVSSLNYFIPTTLAGWIEERMHEL